MLVLTITISLLAAGWAVAAAMPATHLAPPPHTADERGITLQTIIITAVLVLMAVGAGVLILALANRSSDDFTGQTTNLGRDCNRVEILNPAYKQLEAMGANLDGRAEGSAYGCVPVCVWKDVSDNGEAYGTVDLGDEFAVEQPAVSPIKQAAATDTPNNNYLLVSPTSIFTYEEATSTRGAWKIDFEDGIAEIRLNGSKTECRPHDAGGQVLTLASDGQAS